MLIHSTVLINGLKVVLAHQPNLPVISAGVFVRQGSRNEDEFENGISHFLEHLIFNNQRAILRNKTAVKEIINNGGILNAHTTKECTSYEGISLRQHASLLLRSLYELVFEADFTEEDVEAERQVILAELNRKLHGSDQVVDYLANGIYGNNGYGNWILGSTLFIQQVKADQMRQCYQKTYVADNIALVILTDLSVHDLIPVIEEIFSKVPSGAPNSIEVPVSESIHLKLLRQKNTSQIYMCLGGVAPSKRDEHVSSFQIAMSAWGGIPNSRLFMSARERYGLVYQIQTFYHHYIQTGYWGIFTSVSKENFATLMSVIAEEIHSIRSEAMCEEEILRTVSVVKTNLLKNLQQPEFFLRLLGRSEVFRETVYANDLVRRLELATTEVMHEMMKQYVLPDNLSCVVMGNIETDEMLQLMSRLEG